MKTVNLLVGFSIPLLFFFATCNKDDIKPTPVDDSTETVNYNCNLDCPDLIIPFDPYDNNPSFYGYADPSIRRSIHNNVTWLAYSFPHLKNINGKHIPSVEIHLAKSTDNGVNWTFVKKLFEPIPMNNPSDPVQSGVLDHETVNLLPISEGSNEYWLAARLNYFIPTVGGFGSRPGNSFYISILKSNSIENLTSGEIATIGGSLTDAAWDVDQTLIPDDLKYESFFWNEPALYYDNKIGKLYLIMVAFVYQGINPVLSKHKTYVYSTSPVGKPNTWNWEYKGILVDQGIANELGADRLSQLDLAKGKDGKILLIASPDDWVASAGDYNHKGCKVLEVKSLEQPQLERDSKGKLRVRVSISASDANNLGSGASASDATSETGILFTKRIKTNTMLTASIHKTGIKP